MKRCSTCKLEKPVSEFYRRHDRPSGRASACKTCDKARCAAKASEYPRDKEKRRVQMRRWVRKNRERERTLNRDKLARRRARMAGASVETTEYVEMLVCDPCSYCGGPTEHIDHIEPIVAGGAHEWENLTAACRSCNTSKHGRSLLVFLLG